MRINSTSSTGEIFNIVISYWS